MRKSTFGDFFPKVNPFSRVNQYERELKAKQTECQDLHIEVQCLNSKIADLKSDKFALQCQLNDPLSYADN